MTHPELLAHLKNPEADVDPVKIGDNVEEKQEGHEPPHQAGDDGGFEAVGSGVQNWVHGHGGEGGVLRGARILLQAELLPNNIDNLGGGLADVDYHGSPWLFEIGHLAGQNRLAREVTMARLQALRDQCRTSLQVDESDLRPRRQLFPVCLLESGAREHEIS